MSERIVAKFGLDTMDIIEKASERLSEVEGISPKRIAMITKAWEEQKEIKEIMIFLQGHGVSAAYSAKIYKQYGDRSIEVVKENPYRLARDIPGIGFITADRIAQKVGIDSNSLIRAKAGVIYVLNELTDEGHVYYPERDLIRKANEILKVDQEIITKAIAELSAEREIFTEDMKDGADRRAVYLAPFYVAEAGVAQRLRQLKESPSIIRPINPEKAIEWVQKKLNIEGLSNRPAMLVRPLKSFKESKNVFVGNDLDRFKSSTADVVFEKESCNNLLIGCTCKVQDLGSNNSIQFAK